MGDGKARRGMFVVVVDGDDDTFPEPRGVYI
jgi:hypothetical protein